MKGFFISGLLVSSFYYAQQMPKDSLDFQQIEAVHFTRRLPVTKEIINVQKDLDQKNLGQDLPVLLKNQTSVISTSDAGNGVGYTGLRIRGVGGNSINVMMNGVPYNDSESQGTFFVDVPDLASSASQIVIQRGVGTSSNGVSAFGASVNVISKDPEDQFYLKTDDSYGSFNTYKYSAEIGSGKLWKNRLSVMGRYTKIHSDGYIDRAKSDLDSYHFTALFEEGNTRLRLMAFGGKEKTYQAWNGIDKETWESNPKFNYSGAIYDAGWENIVGFYKNENDNYRQNHYQLLWEQKFSSRWNLETTFHFTKGKGYYENYKQEAKFSKYNLPNIDENGTEIKTTDFIRKKWLNNDFYGLVSTLYGNLGSIDLNFGAVANQYYGRHYGNVTGVYYPEINEHEYYRNRSVKNEVAGFAKAIWKLGQWELFGDLQLRNIGYNTKIIQAGDDEGINLDKNWTFFNPKAGVSLLVPSGKIYLSYANARREPNRDDLVANPETKPEQLHDVELGYERSFGNIQLSANAYYMYYVDQLVLTGGINNVGAFIRANSGKSYRMGIEIGALADLSEKWTLSGNFTWSRNRNKDFRQETGTGVENLGNTPISFSPDVLGNILLNFRPFKNFSLGLQNQYVGKQYLDNTDNAAYQLDDYFMTDFNASYLLRFPGTDVEFKFLLNNLFNKKYVNNGFVYDETPYYYSQAGTNFMFGITLKFK
ncbi:TonB-dependent receptor [Daejeonia sp. YH14]|uniref:TonB-dependent receptor n=1 Tax=Daejeonia sp. YH14 TaxID=3439042 RepID=UPI003F497023